MHVLFPFLTTVESHQKNPMTGRPSRKADPENSKIMKNLKSKFFFSSTIQNEPNTTLDSITNLNLQDKNNSMNIDVESLGPIIEPNKLQNTELFNTNLPNLYDHTLLHNHNFQYLEQIQNQNLSQPEINPNLLTNIPVTQTLSGEIMAHNIGSVINQNHTGLALSNVSNLTKPANEQLVTSGLVIPDQSKCECVSCGKSGKDTFLAPYQNATANGISTDLLCPYCYNKQVLIDQKMDMNYDLLNLNNSVMNSQLMMAGVENQMAGASQNLLPNLMVNQQNEFGTADLSKLAPNLVGNEFSGFYPQNFALGKNPKKPTRKYWMGFEFLGSYFSKNICLCLICL